MNRFAIFLTFFRALVWAHLRREPLRAAATLLAIVLGVALVLSIDLANASAVASFSSSVDVVAQNVNLQVLGTGRGFAEKSFLAFAHAPQVLDAEPIIEDELTLGAKAGDPFSGDVLHVIGADLLHQPRGNVGNAAWSDRNQTPVDPNLLVNGHGVIIGNAVAKRYRLHTGSQLSGLVGDRNITLTVAQILPSAVPGIDSSVIFVDIATAQEIFDRPGLLDRIDLQVDPAHRDVIARQLASLVPPGARILTPQNRTGEIRRMLASFQLNLSALSYVALLVGLFLIYNTVAISVVQRRGEIGVVRALGATRAQIMRCFLSEGACFGAVGALLGLVVGAFLAQYSVAAVTKTVDTMYVSTHSDGVVYSVWPFVKAFLLGLFASTAAAWYPAREAAATLPAMTMRTRNAEIRHAGFSRRTAIYGAILLIVAAGLSRLPAIDSVPLFGYASGLAIIGGGALLVPAGIRVFSAFLRTVGKFTGATTLLAASNLGAAQRRNAVAVASLMTAVGMMVAIAILVSSFRTTVVAWADDTLRADLFVRPLGLADASYSAHLDPGLLTRFSRISGVASLDTFRAMSLPFHGRLTTLAGVDFATVSEHRQLRFLQNPDIATVVRAVVSGTSAVVSEPFATRFSVRVGDTVNISTPTGPQHFQIAAIYNDYSSDSGFLLIDRATYTRLFHDDTVNSIAIYAKPGVNLLDLRSRLARAAAPAHVDIESTRELRGYVVTIFNRTFAITYALYIITIAIAVLGVVSTLFALVLERRVEIGVLRYIGLTTAGVRKMILIEAAAVGVLGGLYGLAVGALLAFLLIYVINRQAFGWLIELQMPWAFLGEAVVMVTVAAVISGLLPARIAATMQTASVTRDE